MKKNVFTRVMSIVLTIVPLISIAQTVHNVTVGPGMTYTPASLSINQGDIVSWTSLGGTHDVNFALNSITGESFDNPAEVLSLPVQGAGEMGTITFDVPGTYNYDCSVGSHAAMGMVGSVSVIQNIDQDLASIANCGDFEEGNNPAWAHILTATTVADGSSSQELKHLL